MIKQLFFTFSLLACGNALSMTSTSAGAHAADAQSVKEAVRVLSEPELQELRDAIIDYSERGAPLSNGLETVKRYLSFEIDVTDPAVSQGYRALLHAIEEKQALIDVDRSSVFAQLMIKEFFRLNYVKALFDKYIEPRKHKLPKGALTGPRKNDPETPSRKNGIWSFGYRHLLGGLGFLAVVAGVIQYQRNKRKN